MYHRTEEVLKALKIEWDEDMDKAVIPCPECGSERAFSVEVSSELGHCFKCGCSVHNMAEYVMLKHDISKREAYAKLDEICGGEKNASEGCGSSRASEDWKESLKKKEREPVEVVAPPEVLDKVYRALLRVCPLDDAHREALHMRGLTDEEIQRLGYGTMDLAAFARKRNITGANWLKTACDCVAGAVEREGEAMTGDPWFTLTGGIPGFYDTPADWRGWTGKAIVPCYRGILIPYRNERGQIVGMQIRQDKCLTDKDGHQGPRYVWLSSRGKDGGATPGTPVHWAQRAEEINARGVYLTEGGLKGDIFRAVTGANVIAVPGVNAIKGVPAALEVLKARGVEVVVCAYDMDYLTNESVKNAVDKLRKIVEASGMQWIRLRWDDRGGVLKGCDDWAVWKRRGIAPGGQRTA